MRTTKTRQNPTHSTERKAAKPPTTSNILYTTERLRNSSTQKSGEQVLLDARYLTAGKKKKSRRHAKKHKSGGRPLLTLSVFFTRVFTNKPIAETQRSTATYTSIQHQLPRNFKALTYTPPAVHGRQRRTSIRLNTAAHYSPLALHDTPPRATTVVSRLQPEFPIREDEKLEEKLFLARRGGT